MKKIAALTILLIAAATAQAQLLEPVHFKSELKTGAGDEAEIIFTALIDAGWHIYSTDLGSGGPTEATFNVVKMEGAEPVGRLMPRGNEQSTYDKLFDMQVRYFENKAQFVQKIRFTQRQYDIDCYLEYGACNDQSCMPPAEVKLTVSGTRPEAAAIEKTTGEAGKTGETGKPGEATDSATAATPAAAAAPTAPPTADSLWQTSVSELRAFSTGDSLQDYSLIYILLLGFVGGLLAVCMPCIWPIIPMTVSFFLKRAQTNRGKGIRDAVNYGLSIIVIYLLLGLLVTALFGSDALNALSTNAVFNVFLCVLLIVFALSFFGWFEIKLPEAWANKVDRKSEQTSGIISVFLMAFTLVLVSFSCTAPIIGLLLVETTTSGNWLAPALGMLGFALALALPFTLFALFPAWLKQAPKSGSWMTTLKVVLGFIELAFALKFFSVADLAYGWHLMDREVFLSLWIVIFALLGAYLCGWLKFQADEVGSDVSKPKPVACIMGGLVSMAFALYMVPGLWGAPCKAVSAFAPPMNTQDFNLNTQTVEARFTEYETGMAAARAEGKPVLIDFTGFGCVNCRKMEAAVWTDPTVARLLTDDYVLISLYVDDKTPLAEPLTVTDSQGRQQTLRTVGAKWSYLQSHKFGANAQPFYVILDSNGTPLAGSRAYDEDIPAYIDFLSTGLENHKR